MSVDQATSTQQLLIGGEWRDAASGRQFAQTFPYKGELSTERAVADRSIAGALTEKLAERARALPVGDPREPTTATGPLVSAAALERVSGLVADAVDKGAEAVCGGEADGPCFPVHDEPQMPFGGVKASGSGRFGARAALEELTELRWITVREQPREYPI